MLITLVENAIKHGIEPLPEGGRIDVTATQEAHADGARVVLSVADTGTGLTGSPGVNGIGLANIRERLALQHGERAALETDANHPRGFVARLVLPLGAAPQRAAAAPLMESALR
jgi:sensor histidine kinase YesM